MRLRVIHATQVIVFALAGATVCVRAQFSRDPVTNFLMRQAAGIPTIADQAAALMGSVKDMAALKAELNVRLESARARYWQLYPDRPGFEEARREFSGRLRDKDQLYLVLDMTGLNNPLLSGLTGDIDGGIHPTTKLAFDRWVVELRESFADITFEDWFRHLLNPALTKAKFAKAQPLYDAYVARRDWEEFRKRGRTPPGVSEEMWRFVERAIALKKTDPYGDAATVAEQGGFFSQRCASELPKAIGISPKPGACACIQALFEKAVPAEMSKLELQGFSSEQFLLTSVSKVGLHQQVAACIR